jgi:hypothetical protein
MTRLDTCDPEARKALPPTQVVRGSNWGEVKQKTRPKNKSYGAKKKPY